MILVGSIVAGVTLLGDAGVAEQALTHRVNLSNLRITVTERGNLESQKTVDGVCGLRGYQNKIIYIVEEGKTVQKGEVVVRFDSAEIEKNIAEHEIEVAKAKSLVETTAQEVEVKVNEGKSLVAAAELELKLAKLDLEKYRDGDYKVTLNDLQGKISLAEVAVERARDKYENFKVLVKKGFREPEQLRTEQQEVATAQFNLNRDKEQLNVLKKYEYVRQLTEFQAKAEEAERKLERAIATDKATVAKAKAEAESAKGVLKMEEQNLKEWVEQKEKCEIIAKQTGVLAYANEDWYDSDRRIREGAIVYRRQKIFSLPDMTLMQVKVNVHESMVKKVKAEQKAKIRVDAFANETFAGTVKSVAQLADSSNSWRRGGVKEYTTIVTLDESPKIAIKPGMTAEVEILVDYLRDVISVPVQAVTEHKHQHYAYVKVGNDFERKEVEIGQSNNRMVEIVSGLEIDQEVALDARARGIIDFEDDDLPDSEEDEAPPEPASATSNEEEQESKGDEEAASEDSAAESTPGVAKADSVTNAEAADESEPMETDGKSETQAETVESIGTEKVGKESNAGASEASDASTESAGDVATSSS